MKVQPARLTNDAEFFRRINLDLTGRIPAATDIQAFVDNTDPGKRDAVIEKLLYSQEFIDKWTMWLGDVLVNNVSQVTAAVNRQIDGRNQFYEYLYWSVAGWAPLRAIAWDAIAMTGNNYDLAAGGCIPPTGLPTHLGSSRSKASAQPETHARALASPRR